MTKKVSDSEIDLLEIILKILDEKWKIISFAAVALILTVIYQTVQYKEPTFRAITEIRPISTFQEFKYETYNSYLNLTVNTNQVVKIDNYNEEGDRGEDSNIKIEKNTENKKSENEINFKLIKKDFLLNLFIEKLNENEIFIDAIKKFNLIKQDNYENQQAYEDEISKLAASITLLPPDNFRTNKDAKEKYWRIQFITTDKEKWQKFLKYIQKPTNDEIRQYLEQVFKELITNEKKLKKFMIEDVEIKIQNAYDNYDREISRKLVFLKEQAEIARKLNIPKNNYVEAQSFVNDSGIITNLRAQIPYYMKGFEMIEKEIDLIENRTNSDAFTKGLSKLEKVMKELTTNKDLERLEALFKDTPISNPESFSAANIMFLSTNYDEINKSKNIRMAIIAALFGSILGIFFVLIQGAIRSRE